jgi:hypothetical protein
MTSIAPTPTQPELPLEFRDIPFTDGEILFHVTSQPSDPKNYDREFDDLTYNAIIDLQDMPLRHISGSVDDAFAAARALTTPPQQGGAAAELGQMAAVTQTSDGYWVLPAHGVISYDQDGAWDTDDPPFSPNYRDPGNQFDSRTWEKSHPALIGIANRGKVLDMRGTGKVIFNGYSQPPVS